MRVLIAPDKFAGSLTAGEVAEHLARGWLAESSEDHLELLPLADGGPGFVAALHRALGGELRTVIVTGPLREKVAAPILRVSATAYIEAASACGLSLVSHEHRDPARTTSYGVGELIRAAIDDGCTGVVVGLGGSATNDGGAGMLAALGAVGTGDGSGADLLAGGGLGLAGIQHLDLSGARRNLQGVTLLAASDVASPLLGPHGATRGFGPQKGATTEQVADLEAALAFWADRCEAAGAPDLRDAPGAGAAGGLGFGMLVAGALRVSGIDTVLGAVGLADRIADSDLVITGEGKFDWQSGEGKVVSGVAAAAAGKVPVWVVAGQVEADTAFPQGVMRAYSLTESAGTVDRAMAAAGQELARLGQVLARHAQADLVPVRTATAADADGIWRILEPILRAGETYAMPRDMEREAALVWWLGGDHETWIAESDGEVVGTYYLHPNQQGPGSHVANCGYATAFDHAGRGIAAAMCEHSLARARERGYLAMQFNLVVASNSAAVRLWRLMGFATVGRIPGAFRHPELGLVDALVLYRRLDGG